MVATATEEQRARERVKISLEQATAIFAEKNIRFTELQIGRASCRERVYDDV